MSSISKIALNNTEYGFETESVKNTRTDGKIKFWTGTRDQYNALVNNEQIDNNTLYNITDDNNLTLTLLEVLWPVDSVFLTYGNTCPLQTLGIGTWIKEDTGIITSLSESVQVKGNGKTLGLTNGTDDVSLSVNSNNAGNNHNLFQPSAFNIDVTTSGYGDSGPLGSYGVTTDGSKSGMIADTSSLGTKRLINIFRRTA